MSAVVLVHGAWHGGWCWRDVAALLRAAGHSVFAPTLTGLGDRAHLLSGDVSLATHVADIVGLLDAEELADVTLVGHSYGAMPTALACAHPAVARWMSLDGVPVVAGDSLIPADTDLSLFEAMLVDGVGFPPMPAETLGIPPDHPGHAWVNRRLTPMPWNCLVRPFPPLPARFHVIAKAFVSATGNTLGGPLAGMAQAHADGWAISRIDSGHDLMVTAPEETAAVIRGFSEGS